MSYRDDHAAAVARADALEAETAKARSERDELREENALLSRRLAERDRRLELLERVRHRGLLRSVLLTIAGTAAAVAAAWVLWVFLGNPRSTKTVIHDCPPGALQNP